MQLYVFFKTFQFVGWTYGNEMVAHSFTRVYERELASVKSRSPRRLQTGKPSRSTIELKRKMVDSLPGLVRKSKKELTYS